MKGESKMTIRELIEKLEKLDGDKEIFIAFAEEDGHTIQTVEDGPFATFLIGNIYDHYLEEDETFED